MRMVFSSYSGKASLLLSIREIAPFSFLFDFVIQSFPFLIIIFYLNMGRNKIDQIVEIVTGNPTVIKMVVHFNRYVDLKTTIVSSLVFHFLRIAFHHLAQLFSVS